MAEERPKVAAILEHAMDILREHGDHGLSMRKIAECAGISLGHLQHYFPTKGDVLKGLVSSHFELCVESLREHIAGAGAADAKRRVAGLIDLGFAYVRDEDTARVFRELWALSSRHTEVRAHLGSYYRDYTAMLVAYLRPVARSKVAAQKAVALLLPWFEGYSVTADERGLDERAMAKQLAGAVMEALGAASPA